MSEASADHHHAVDGCQRSRGKHADRYSFSTHAAAVVMKSTVSFSSDFVTLSDILLPLQLPQPLILPPPLPQMY